MGDLPELLLTKEGEQRQMLITETHCTEICELALSMRPPEVVRVAKRDIRGLMEIGNYAAGE